MQKTLALGLFVLQVNFYENIQGCHASFTRPRETDTFENCPREIGLFVHSPLESF